MRFRLLAAGQTALELAGPDRAPLVLLVWWGDGYREPTRAAWLWRRQLAGWAVVGEA